MQIYKQGDILWETMAGGSGTDELRDMLVTDDGGVLLLAHTSSHDGDVTDHHGSWDLWMIKIDSSGQKQWSKSFGGAGFEEGGSVIQTSDGGYLLVGDTDGSGGFMVVGATGSDDGDVEGYNGIDVGIYEDVWLAKLDSAGNLEWQYCYGGGGRETIYRGVVQKDDFNYVITLGTDTDAWQCGGVQMPDLRVVELYDTTVGIDETVENTVGMKVYPNPANSTFNLTVKPGKNMLVKVFDIFGKQVIETAMPETGEQQIDVSSWPAGLYLVSLFNDGKFISSEKVVIK